MARRYRIDADVDQLWEDFHACVNVSSAQLRAWLMTEGSREEAFTDPKMNLDSRGGAIMAILGKRKVDLTDDDIAVMSETVEDVQRLLERRPPNGPSDDRWRRALLDLGHDPLQEPKDSLRSERGRETLHHSDGGGRRT
ncbi:Protein of unknown function [Micromonospora pattaloongensis]|uniref:DUF3140 domain-containing protein n=1 Tax=Micromonospora pattaloongensis TaxID=405436 RepID=A0A1H3PDX9_9ACTN|nr:Protein of unknown function [Micromonospora pattaloongensis]